MVQELNGSTYLQMLREGVNNLNANRQLVNDLNVFPIPDGDTGDNMLITIAAGCDAVSELDSDKLGDVAAAAARGMLYNAQGNSGTILSRIFSGIANAIREETSAPLDVICRAFNNGVKEAYSAVEVPVEGTMLTVFREAVEYVSGKLDKYTDMETFWSDFQDGVKESLKRTPELLDVLKKAGVVDSGGAGFMYIVDGMTDALRGKNSGNSAEDALREVRGDQKDKNTPDLTKFTEDSELTFGYCTEFLLRLQRAKTDPGTFDVDAFTAELKALGGESIVCFKEDSIVKVHVHSMRPGEILDLCQRYGEFLTMKIENMNLQHNETVEKPEVPDETGWLRIKTQKKYGIVAVAYGEGLINTFVSLGVDEVVNGGQSMNPSVKDFIDAFDRIPADHIIVFPNNGNVILTAQQAAKLYDKADVRVVRSHSIGEGYAAVSSIDLSCEDPAEVVAACEEICGEVVTGLVSKASRDSNMSGIDIHEGDYIGFSGDDVYSDCPLKNDAALALMEALKAGNFDVVMVIKGASASEDEAAELAETLEKKYKRTEFILLNGGQPVYDYIFVLE